MRAVFLDTQTFSENIQLTDIKQYVSALTEYPLTSPEQVLERCTGYDIVISNKVVLDRTILSNLPDLKLICVSATGTNNVDLDVAKQQRIAVTNAAGYAGPPVAQYIISQLLDYYQNIHHHNQNTQQGKWQQSSTFCYFGNPIEELAGKTLGLIGYGHIAQHLEKIARAFDMKIMVSEHQHATNIRSGRYCFKQVLTESDIISLHCPLTDDTHHLIDETALNLMKTSAVLVNTARGQIVDTMALKEALEAKQIGFAVLDVLEQEPPPANHPLLTSHLNNINITAHIAWASQQAQQRIIAIVADNIRAFLANEYENRVV